MKSLTKSTFKTTKAVDPVPGAGENVTDRTPELKSTLLGIKAAPEIPNVSE
jgi:hypothetical protein